MSRRQIAAVAGLALGLMSGAASASTILSVSGSLSNNSPPQAFTAQINLNTTGTHVDSATGTFTGFGLTNADLVLITTSTPGNENNDPAAPVGFRSNGGTDLFGADQNYPLTFAGLLFDVGTKTDDFGPFPLFNLYDNGGGNYAAIFTGNVGANTFYVYQGSVDVSASVSAVPLPASAPMFGAALLALGAAGYGLKCKKAAAAA